MTILQHCKFLLMSDLEETEEHFLKGLHTFPLRKTACFNDDAGFLFVDNLLHEARGLSDVIEQVGGGETADKIRSKCDIVSQTAAQLSDLRKKGMVGK